MRKLTKNSEVGSPIAVFRSRVIVTIAGVGTAFFLIIVFGVLTSAGQSGALIGGAVFAGAVWLMWAMGWRTKVVVARGGVIIDNFLVRHVIPAGQFNRFVLDSGIWAEMKDGRRIWLFGYGGSLIGAMTGYRAMRPVLAGMEKACQQMTPSAHDSRSYASRIVIGWLPLAGLLVLFESVILVSRGAH